MKQHNYKLTPKLKRIESSTLRSITLPSLAALTLSACGGGASNRPPTAAPNSTIAVDEDSTDNALAISAPTDLDTNDTLTITVNEVPSGGTVTTSSGTIVNQGSTLTVNDLTGLVFTKG